MFMADIRLSQLLAARLCHELVGPVTAVINGAEIIGDADIGTDPDALALLRESAQRTGRRLQFYRFIYGFVDEGGAAGPPPYQLAADFFANSRLSCRYGETARARPLREQQLGCNLLALGAEMLPHSGSLAIDVVAAGLRLEATGEGIAADPEQLAALSLSLPMTALTPRTVQGYFTALLARSYGARLIAENNPPRRLTITAARAKD
jgi:histidine phosphotransferase ChpT